MTPYIISVEPALGLVAAAGPTQVSPFGPSLLTSFHVALAAADVNFLFFQGTLSQPNLPLDISLVAAAVPQASPATCREIRLAK